MNMYAVTDVCNSVLAGELRIHEFITAERRLVGVPRRLFVPLRDDVSEEFFQNDTEAIGALLTHTEQREIVARMLMT